MAIHHSAETSAAAGQVRTIPLVNRYDAQSNLKKFSHLYLRINSRCNHKKDIIITRVLYYLKPNNLLILLEPAATNNNMEYKTKQAANITSDLWKGVT